MLAQNSQLTTLLRAWLEKEIESAYGATATYNDPVHLYRAQGHVAAYHSLAKRIPPR